MYIRLDYHRIVYLYAMLVLINWLLLLFIEKMTFSFCSFFSSVSVMEKMWALRTGHRPD